MKKMFFSLSAAVLFTPISFCQSNNPQNQLGIEVVNLAKAIYADYTAGKIKEVNQETLDYYFDQYLPKYQKVELAAFNNVFNAIKNSDNSSIIKNAGYSDQGTAFLKKSLQSYSITKLVDEVNASKISEKEKSAILSVLAINYNLMKPYFKENQPPAGKGPNASSFEDSLDLNSAPLSEGAPAIIWGGLGFITGNAICGPLCGVFGGTIGLIFGGWANDRGNTTIGTTGSSSSWGSSGGNGSGSWAPLP